MLSTIVQLDVLVSTSNVDRCHTIRERLYAWLVIATNGRFILKGKKIANM